MDYESDIQKRARRAKRAQARSRAFHDLDAELLEGSHDKLDKSADLLRSPVWGLPRGERRERHLSH